MGDLLRSAGARQPAAFKRVRTVRLCKQTRPGFQYRPLEPVLVEFLIVALREQSLSRADEIFSSTNGRRLIAIDAPRMA